MQGKEHGLVWVFGIDLSQFIGHPLHRFLRIGIVPGTLEEVLTTVQNDEVKAVDHVVVGCQQRHLAQFTIVGILVESLAISQLANVVLHGVGVVVACIIRFGDIVPVGHLVVVVACHVDHGC